MSKTIPDILRAYDESVSSIVGDIFDLQAQVHRDLRAAGVDEKFFGASDAENMAAGQIQVNALVLRGIAERHPESFVKAAQAFYGANEDMLRALEGSLQRNLPRNGNPFDIDPAKAAATWIEATTAASESALQRRIARAGGDTDVTLTTPIGVLVGD